MKRKYKRRVVSFPVLSRPQNGNFYLGIMGAQLMAPLNPYDVGGVSGGPWCRETPFSRTTTPHSCFLTSKLNSKTIPVLPSLDPSLIFPFHLLPSPVHPTGFSFCFFPAFVAIFILLSSNNSNIASFVSVSSLPIHCHFYLVVIELQKFSGRGVKGMSNHSEWQSSLFSC